MPLFAWVNSTPTIISTATLTDIRRPMNICGSAAGNST